MTDTNQAELKFYTDAHIAKVVATQLRLHGIDVIRCQEVHMDDATDIEHLTLATEQGRCMVTHDADFAKIHTDWITAGKTHCGVFYITHDKDNIGMIVETLTFWHEAIQSEAANLTEDVYNQLLYVP